MSTRQLLEDIKSQLLGEAKKENVKVFGLTVQVEESFADYANEEYTYMVRYKGKPCLLYTSPSPRDGLLSRMPSSA